ncbi:Protein of unknown function [Lactobacillus helveticus CIRM-BIA 101]|uniref:Uncharacterized protein n=1 Tax=Lactobacillus helveticus CIRM-BIA 104 TaxID=1226333 RepID=U6FBX8_LACHE|nr:Protein of unknown function [Lactobacillus helveticus CIRM-BIA 104]CDI63662.1 Protein of unknown function [Lactobacillus helveticus CIRM-BIA 103]CDI65918.1 Protein of unknown function [Lactobacillus helveticus CIRM-BIA 101]
MRLKDYKVNELSTG